MLSLIKVHFLTFQCLPALTVALSLNVCHVRRWRHHLLSNNQCKMDEEVSDSHRTGSSGNAVLVELKGIVGAQNKQNDMLYYGPVDPSAGDGNLLYFGGDIQDFESEMSRRDASIPYVSRSLESTAVSLGSKFPAHNVWVIRARLMHEDTYASYKNLVKSDDFGVPSYYTDFAGLVHCRALLITALKVLKHKLDKVKTSSPGMLHNMTNSSALKNKINTSYHEARNAGETLESDVDKPTNVPGYHLPITLIGFSKGCVVLNQFLYEIYQTRQRPEMAAFLNQIKHWYWLDGGHCGGTGTWITNRVVLTRVIEYDWTINVAVSPYQINDDVRFWIGIEEQKFHKWLEHLGVDLSRIVYFENEPGSLENHFKVLDVFVPTSLGRTK